MLGGRPGGDILGQQQEPAKELLLVDGKYPHLRPSSVPLPAPAKNNIYRLFSASAGKQPVFKRSFLDFLAGENFVSWQNWKNCSYGRR